jgi:hypothetical protein
MQKQNLPVIQSLWIGEKLTKLEQLSIASFLKNGHPYHLYVYDEVQGIPDGVTLKNAIELVPAEKIFKYKDHNSYAGFSNLFRYKLLLEKGGYWVDADFVCLQPFYSPIDPEYIFATEYVEGPSPQVNQFRINTGVIMVPPGSELMEYCYDESVRCNPQDLVWGETGPLLLEKAVNRFGMQNHAAKPSTFCPIPTKHWAVLKSDMSQKPGMEESIKAILFDARAIHFWNELWRRAGIDKDADFPQNSVYEKLKKYYLDEINFNSTRPPSS